MGEVPLQLSSVRNLMGVQHTSLSGEACRKKEAGRKTYRGTSLIRNSTPP
jgi:hypothetical protein